MLKLYDYFRSSASFRVRIALNLKNVKYEIIPVHLLKNGGEQHDARYQKLNPQALVPSLETPDGIITQSLAIIGWLDEQYPSPPLVPENAYERALAKSFALSIAADIHPLNNLRVLNYLKDAFNITDEEKNVWYQHWVMKGLLALESQLKLQKYSGDFCYGNQPSIADICLVPQLYNAKRFNCDLSNCETLVRIDHNCQKLAAFTDAWPAEEMTT